MTLVLKAPTAGPDQAETAELQDITMRFWIGCRADLAGVCLGAMIHIIPALAMQPWVDSDASRCIQFSVATPVIWWAGWPFFERGWRSIVTLHCDFLASGCGRPDGSVGYAMLFNILHVENPVELLREAFRVLVPGGLAGIIHWKSDAATPRGHSIDIRPRPEQCREWAETPGFNFVRNESLCCCSWHYGLVVNKPIRRTLSPGPKYHH